MVKKDTLRLALTCFFAFAGGAVSEQLFTSQVAMAAAGEIKAFFDQTGMKRLDIGVVGNSPLQDFYGPDGRLRIQFGTYTTPGEIGLPLAALSDNNGTVRLLLRLAGANQSPVLVFKDSTGNDRMVMGLSLNGEAQEPFLSYKDSKGNHLVFGEQSDIPQEGL